MRFKWRWATGDYLCREVKIRSVVLDNLIIIAIIVDKNFIVKSSNGDYFFGSIDNLFIIIDDYC